MTAVNSKINEPSMEDILASIRRIIADDQEILQGSRDIEPSGESSPLRNVLDIAELHASPVALPIQPAPEPSTGEDEAEPVAGGPEELPVAAPEVAFTPALSSRSPYRIERDPPRPAAPAHQPALRRPATPPTPAADACLLSDEANASVAGAFDRLGSTIASSPPKTLEDIAKEMLRPMLKTWLDDNLPPLVERLVQAEIERVSRGRR